MLIMENSEEVLQILERFTKLKQKDIPKELEDYLCFVAKTGDTVYRWANVKYLFREKLMNVIKDFHDSTQSIDDLPQYPNVDPFNYETMKSALLERLEVFNAAPFTIQRLCELLTDPRKQYSRIDKYMRALEKNILVVSTVEPGRKQPESENGDSLDSVVNGDISLDVNVDIDMENESIFRMEAQNTSSSSGSSSNKAEDCGASEPKRFKVDNTEDNSSDKSKSGSDSDESSDDSDNQTPVEASQDRHASESSSSETSTPDINLKQTIDSERKEDAKQDQTVTANIENDEINSNKEQPEPSSTNEASTQEVEKKSEEIEQKPEEHKISSKTESEVSNETKGRNESCPANSPEDVSTLTRNPDEVESVDEKNAEQSPEPIVNLKPENPNDSTAEENNTQNTTDFAVKKSQLEPHPQVSEEAKIPEEMSIEEPQVSSTTGPQEQPAPVAHQPMDENLEPELTPSCATDTSTMNEVVMQTETEMATEPIKVMGEDKSDQGMDVDDTSQEAMDQ